MGTQMSGIYVYNKTKTAANKECLSEWYHILFYFIYISCTIFFLIYRIP